MSIAASVPPGYARALLVNPLRDSPETVAWLDALERRVWRVEQMVAQAVADADVLPVVPEAHAALHAWLHDERGVYRRALARPIWQLGEGRAGRATLERGAALVAARAERALATQRAMDVLRADIAALQAAHAPRIPHSVADLLARAQLTPDVLVACATPQGVARLRRRLAWVEAQLAPIADAFDSLQQPTGATSPQPLTTDLADGESGPPAERELRARWAVRARERKLVRNRGQLAPLVTAITAQHRLAMIAAAGRAPGTREPGIELAEHVITSCSGDVADVGSREVDGALSIARAGFRGDSALWQVLLDDAWQLLAQSVRRPMWHPVRPDVARVAATDSAQVRPDSPLAALPIDDRFVWITRSEGNGTRVETDGVLTVGGVATARLTSPPGESLDAATARIDLPVLFDGVPLDRPVWLRTSRGATLRVIAAGADDAFAEVMERGRAASLGDPPWVDEVRRAHALRVLPASHDGRRSHPVGIVRDAGVPGRLGFRTRVVPAPIAGHERAWWRTAEPATEGRRLALERERALFTALLGASPRARSSARFGLTPLGLGYAEDADQHSALYALPTLVSMADGRAVPLLDEWLRKSREARHALVASGARLALAVRGAGWAIGVFHRDVLGVTCTGDGTSLRPAAVLVTAPLATPQDATICGSLPLAGLAGLTYDRLRFRGLVPGLETGATVEGACDARAWAVWALEILARDLGEREEWCAEWNALLARLLTLPDDRWSDASESRRLVEVLQGGSEEDLWAEVDRWAK